MRKLEEGNPLELSDKWGKPAHPYSVKLESTFEVGKTLEFWFCGDLEIQDTSFYYETFTHFALVQSQILLNFKQTDQRVADSRVVIKSSEITEIRVWTKALSESQLFSLSR